MIGIVIVAHDGLAQGYLATLEHILGRLPGTAAVPVAADDDSEAKQDEIDAAIRAVDDGGGVVVVTDMYGGTPSNIAVKTCLDSQRIVICGANMPLLLKLAKARRLPLRDAVAIALTAGRKYINAVDGCGPEPLPIAL